MARIINIVYLALHFFGHKSSLLLFRANAYEKEERIAGGGEENWECLKCFFPKGWEELARPLGVWRREPRSLPSTEALLRILLIHLADGCSLRETAARAREGGFADVSDVALLKRLQASSEWLRWMAVELLKHRGLSCLSPTLLSGYNVRTGDASVVCEPGSTGTDWRVHYSMRLFGLHCDEFHLTGRRVGETCCRFGVAHGDLLMGDRAYSHVKGFRRVLKNGGHFVSRLKNKSFSLVDEQESPRTLNELLSPLAVGEVGHWKLRARTQGQEDIP